MKFCSRDHTFQSESPLTCQAASLSHQIRTRVIPLPDLARVRPLFSFSIFHHGVGVSPQYRKYKPTYHKFPYSQHCPYTIVLYAYIYNTSFLHSSCVWPAKPRSYSVRLLHSHFLLARGELSTSREYSLTGNLETHTPSIKARDCRP